MILNSIDFYKSRLNNCCYEMSDELRCVDEWEIIFTQMDVNAVLKKTSWFQDQFALGNFVNQKPITMQTCLRATVLMIKFQVLQSEMIMTEKMRANKRYRDNAPHHCFHHHSPIAPYQLCQSLNICKIFASHTNIPAIHFQCLRVYARVFLIENRKFTCSHCLNGRTKFLI